MTRVVLVAIFFISHIFALPIENNTSTTEQNLSSEINKTVATVQKPTKEEIAKKKETNKQISKLIEEKKALDKEISDNNIWTKIYSNYHIYKELKNQSTKLYQEIITLESKFELSKEELQKLKKLKEKQTIIQGKLQLLKEYEKDPFKKFITPPKIDDVPTVSNPLAVISAISYQEKLKSDQKEYEEKYNSIQKLIDEIKKKKLLLLELTKLAPNNQEFQKELQELQDKLDTFAPELTRA